MSACLEAAPSIAPAHPSTDLRAARLAKFAREQALQDSAEIEFERIAQLSLAPPLILTFSP